MKEHIWSIYFRSCFFFIALWRYLSVVLFGLGEPVQL